MRLEAITWDRRGDLLAERLLDLKPADGGPWTRVAFDGAPAARPGDLAERVAAALRVRGRLTFQGDMQRTLKNFPESYALGFYRDRRSLIAQVAVEF